MIQKKVYPYHDSLRSALGTCESVSVAVNLVRTLSEMLDIPENAVVILITISGSKIPLTFKQIKDTIPYLSNSRVAVLLKKLKDAKCITFEYNGDKTELSYKSTECGSAAIAHVDKSKLIKPS